METLSDLEITKLCAEAIGYEHINVENRRGIGTDTGIWVGYSSEGDMSIYDPLRNNAFGDAQCFALMKRFAHSMDKNPEYLGGEYFVSMSNGNTQASGRGNNLTRLICECVARMQDADKGEGK